MNLEVRDLADERLAELIRGLLAHGTDNGQRHAALAGRAEGGTGQGIRGGLDVCVR